MPLVTIRRSFTLRPFCNLKLKRPFCFYKKKKNTGEIVVAEIASHCWTSTVGSGCFWLDVVVGCSRKHPHSCCCCYRLFFFFSLPIWFFLRSEHSDSPLLEMSCPASVGWVHMHDRTCKLLLHHDFIPRYFSLSFFLSVFFLKKKTRFPSFWLLYCSRGNLITKRFIVFHSSLNNFLDLNKPGPLSWTVLVLWLIFFSATK